MSNINGVINVFKPSGMTSHDVVSVIRKIYGLKRVGHAGTLDPAAEGVLPVFLGNSTRLIEYLVEGEKGYLARLTFGLETDTGDSTGKITQKMDSFKVPPPDVIKDVLSSFVGTIEQLPPMYSAIKIQGKKLYELARQGITVERTPREVTIYSLNLTEITSSGMLIDVTCSKGTYIRTLCQDIGRKLGILAVMSALVRTKVGRFNITDAWKLEEIGNAKDKVCLPADNFLDMPSVKLYEEKAGFFKKGRSSDVEYPGNFSGLLQDGHPILVKIVDQHEQFIGIGRFSKSADGGGFVAPVKVLAL